MGSHQPIHILKIIGKIQEL